MSLELFLAFPQSSWMSLIIWELLSLFFWANNDKISQSMKLKFDALRYSETLSHFFTFIDFIDVRWTAYAAWCMSTKQWKKLKIQIRRDKLNNAGWSYWENTRRRAWWKIIKWIFLPFLTHSFVLSLHFCHRCRHCRLSRLRSFYVLRTFWGFIHLYEREECNLLYAQNLCCTKLKVFNKEKLHGNLISEMGEIVWLNLAGFNGFSFVGSSAQAHTE